MNLNSNLLKSKLILAAFAAIGLYSCSGNEDRTLPIYGEREVVQREVNGQLVADTLYPKVPDFAFVNQDSQQVSNQNFEGKIYVTDFFFTTCPTICPKMKSQMLRVYEQYKDNPDVLLLSHTIDPVHDTVAVLREYADQLNVSSNKWHFVTGDKDEIYEMASSYYIAAREEEGAEGGFTHSGNFMLIDENRYVRGNYDGTKSEDVSRLMTDIELLLNQKKHAKK